MNPSCPLPLRGRAGVGARACRSAAPRARCARSAPIPTFPRRGKEEYQ
jgi:hypothetical protein